MAHTHNQFVNFLNKLTTPKNAALMEAVKQGYKICCEASELPNQFQGYAIRIPCSSFLAIEKLTEIAQAYGATKSSMPRIKSSTVPANECITLSSDSLSTLFHIITDGDSADGYNQIILDEPTVLRVSSQYIDTLPDSLAKMKRIQLPGSPDILIVGTLRELYHAGSSNI